MQRILKILCCLPLLFLLSCGQNQESTLPVIQETAAITPVFPASAPQEVPEVEEIPLSPVDSLLAEMTTQEKIGQLFMMDFRTNADGTSMTDLSDSVRQQIADYHLGGVILFGENLDTAEQTALLIQELQSSAQLPLFIAVDEEGGTVSRLNASQIPHEKISSPGTITSTEDVQSSATAIGETLFSLGFNVDLAPVADVNTNPNNPVIGSRAYSHDPQIAAERVSVFVTALQDTGISGAAKHFPGHGDTTTDSHTGTAEVSHDLERLETIEFLPFQAAIQSGVQMILVGHISLPNVTDDDLPATLNPKIIDLLRTNLDYDGIAITDAMNMGAITDRYGAGESAVLAIQAGIDIVLMPADLPTAFQAVEDAVDSGRISQDNLDDSVARILQLKYDQGLLSHVESSH